MGDRETSLCGRLTLAAIVSACAAWAGCDPKPSFPPTEQPAIGEIVMEREAFVPASGPLTVNLTGSSQTLYAILNVPQGALPPGTRLLVRIVRGVVKTAPGGSQDEIWHVGNDPGAVQILPPDLTFAIPATLSMPEGRFPYAMGGVLHASEADAAWQRGGAATIEPLPTGNLISAPVDAPHLWTFEWPPLPDPQGSYQQDALLCDGVEVLPVPPDTLTFASGDYVWRRTPRGGCAFVETGQFMIDRFAGEGVFSPVGGPARRYWMRLRVNGFELLLANVMECPQQPFATNTADQSFVLVGGGGDGGADAGCAAEAGQGGDAGVD